MKNVFIALAIIIATLFGATAHAGRLQDGYGVVVHKEEVNLAETTVNGKHMGYAANAFGNAGAQAGGVGAIIGLAAGAVVGAVADNKQAKARYIKGYKVTFRLDDGTIIARLSENSGNVARAKIGDRFSCSYDEVKIILAIPWRSAPEGSINAKPFNAGDLYSPETSPALAKDQSASVPNKPDPVGNTEQTKNSIPLQTIATSKTSEQTAKKSETSLP